TNGKSVRSWAIPWYGPDGLPQAVSTCTLTYNWHGIAAARIWPATSLAITTTAWYTESGASARIRLVSAASPRYSGRSLSATANTHSWYSRWMAVSVMLRPRATSSGASAARLRPSVASTVNTSA